MTGRGVNYETHPPRIGENPGTQNCPSPTLEGGGVGQPTTHPPPPATKAVHKFPEISELFEAYGQSIHRHHSLSHMINQRSLTHPKNPCPHMRRLRTASCFYWDKLCTTSTLRAHCGRTAGTCIKDHPEEMEGGNIKQHMRMQQHNRTI